MLFTDQPAVKRLDLESIDGEFLEVAKVNKINVDENDPSSVLYLSILEAGDELMSRMQNFTGYLVGVAGNSNQLAAVLNILSTAINRPRAMLQMMPVLEPNQTRTALLSWLRYYGLYNFYRAVFHRRLDDRYEAKMNMYEVEKKKKWNTLKGCGFPIILTPLSAPGAVLDYNSGTWDSSNLSAVSGGTQGQDVGYDVTVTWCSIPQYVSPSNQGGSESAGARIANIVVPAGNVIHIDIGSLNPPSSLMPNAIGTAYGVYNPMKATHWNIYANLTDQTPILQNSSPIPVATKTYTFSDSPVLSGFRLNSGQPAQYDFSESESIIWRA